MEKNLFQVFFFILIIFLFGAKSRGGGAEKWWGRGPTSPSPSAVPDTESRLAHSQIFEQKRDCLQSIEGGA